MILNTWQAVYGAATAAACSSRSCGIRVTVAGERCCPFDAAAEPLVFGGDEGDAYTGGAGLSGYRRVVAGAAAEVGASRRPSRRCSTWKRACSRSSATWLSYSE
ncbi:hypothetical protein SHIRM173S_01709 [Streptomyces hirsutus]